MDATNKAYCAEWQGEPSCTSNKEKFKDLYSRVWTELRKMQDLWWQKKAEEVQHYADTHITKQFFNAIKTVYGPSRSGCSSLLSSDRSNLIKDQEGLRDRWAVRCST